MGSSFYTFTEAANRLHRSKRSLHNYIKKGLLRREVFNGDVVLNREDVDEMAADSGVDAPAMTRKSFIELQNRVKKLEDKMTTVQHILEIRDDRIHPTPEQAEAFYRAAEDSLTRRGSWVAKEVEVWASQIERMDETFIEEVCKVTHNGNAWAPFFSLCSEMQAFAFEQHAKKPDVLWQALHKKLNTARSTFRACVVLWIELGRGSQKGGFLGLLDDPKSALLKGLKG